jgi:hypothetical protein
MAGTIFEISGVAKLPASVPSLSAYLTWRNPDLLVHVNIRAFDASPVIEAPYSTLEFVGATKPYSGSKGGVDGLSERGFPL